MERTAKVMSVPVPGEPQVFERLVETLRPKLHRYCARMVGSAIEGEDVVQEALTKAAEAFPRMSGMRNAEAWLFRIAHNTALDFLRQRKRRDTLSGDGDMTMIPDPVDVLYQRQAAAAGLHAAISRNVLLRETAT